MDRPRPAMRTSVPASKGPPRADRWWVWFIVVWANGDRERPFEDYPPWTVVRETQSGASRGKTMTRTAATTPPSVRCGSSSANTPSHEILETARTSTDVEAAGRTGSAADTSMTRTGNNYSAASASGTSSSPTPAPGRNIHKVLLTRGMRDTVVHSTDDETGSCWRVSSSSGHDTCWHDPQGRARNRASAAVDVTRDLPDRGDRLTHRVNGHRDVGVVGRPVADRGAHHRTVAPL